LWHKVLKIN